MFKKYNDNIDYINAEEVNLLFGNFQNLIEMSGMNLDETDLTQVSNSLKHLIFRNVLKDDGDETTISLKWKHFYQNNPHLSSLPLRNTQL